MLKGLRKPDEIIVVSRHDSAELDKLKAGFPNVVLIEAESGTTIPKLRSLGLRRAASSVVVITEDHCVPSKDWLRVVERQIGRGYDMVAGPVENAWDDRIRDSAAFLTEYAFAIRPANEIGEVSEDGPFAGNNAAYRRDLIDGLCRTLDEGRWESFYHDEMRAEGKKLLYDPAMLLYHSRPFDFMYFVSQRFHFCRSFAEMRRESLGTAGRIKYGIGCAVLPPLLWLRGLQLLRKKQRFIGRYFLCSPLIALYLCSGALGEMNGYLFGGGNSLARVE
jgi:hypothetical protein